MWFSSLRGGVGSRARALMASGSRTRASEASLLSKASGSESGSVWVFGCLDNRMLRRGHEPLALVQQLEVFLQAQASQRHAASRARAGARAKAGARAGSLAPLLSSLLLPDQYCVACDRKRVCAPRLICSRS